MDRRALFFLGAGAAALAMYPLAPPDFRWVTIAVAATYVVLAVLAALDAWGRHRDR